jgi:hypothetical protein
LQKSWLSSGFDCPAGSTETMRLVDCTHHGCRLEVLFEDTWGSVCSRGFKEYTAQLTCGMLGFPHGGTLNPARGGGASVVWLSEVECTGREGDLGDCKHEVRYQRMASGWIVGDL